MPYLIGFRDNHFVIDGPQLTKLPHLADWSAWRRTPSGTYLAAPYASSVLQVRLDLPGLDLQWSPAAAAKRDELLRRLQEAKLAIAGGSLPLNWPTPTSREPLPHQWRAVHAARALGWRVLLADDMGLGKTSEALWMAHDAGARRLIVVCPVSVKYNWQAEIAATLGEGWHTVVVDGTPKQRADQLVKVAELCNAIDRVDTTCGAVVINYDLLRHLTAQQMLTLRTFAAGAFRIADECHYLKGRETERTELVGELFKGGGCVVAMSGTPVRDTVEDLYSQAEIVRPGIFRSYTAFADRYLVLREVEFGKKKVRKVVGAKNVEELNAIVNTFQIRRRKEDVLDLPPKMHTYPQLQLDDTTGRVYEAMKRFAKIELERVLADAKGDGETAPTIWSPRAKTGVEAMLRLEQIAQGFLGGIPEPLMQQITPLLRDAERIPGRPTEVIFPNAPKLRWLIDTIESVLLQGGSPIVFSRFNAPLFWLAQHRFAGAIPAVMHGGMSAAEKQQAVRGFQDGVTRVLLCQVKIAEGWNATRCQDVLFLGRDWSPAINHQAEDRAHRMGQKGTVNVQIPVVVGTIEVLVDRRLRAKDADAQQALAGLTIEELLEAL